VNNPNALIADINAHGTWQALDGNGQVWAQRDSEDAAWDYITEAEAVTDIAEWSVREV
jgi:hypothetical protein